MANYNLTEQKISSSFQQLMQHDKDTSLVYDGTGSLITNLDVTSSFATTASYAINHDNPTWDEVQNKPSGLVSGSSQVDLGLAFGTASQATSASHAENSDNAISASYSVSSSQAVSSDTSISSSHAVNADNALEIFVRVKNVGTTTIPKGYAVHSSGVTGENLNVTTASYDDSNLMPAIGITQADINAGAVGEVILSGRLINVDTSGLVAGGTVYVNGDGALTATKPTGSALIQNIGTAVKINATEGEILVLGSGRTNDLPNITEGYAWVGNSNHVPTAVSTASWDAHSDLTQLNAFTASYYVDSASFDTRIDDIVASGSGADWNTNLTNIPSGLVSGSSQINYPDISNIPSGIISGSDQLTGSFARLDAPNTFIDAQTIESTLIISQSAGITGSIMHFPLTGGGGLQGIASNRFFNIGPNLFEQSYQGIDKYILQTVGTGEMEISAATSMVLNPATSGNGQLVSTKIMTQQDSTISGNGQKDSITIGAYTGSNGVIYSSNVWGLQNYPSSGYNQAFVAGKYNSSFNRLSEMRVDEGLVQLTIGDGDFNYNSIKIQDTNAGATAITLQADQINLTNNTSINNLNVGVNHPSSQSLFVGDGAQPRIQVYSQTDAASSGTNVEFNGNVATTNLSVGPNSTASQSLHVDNGAQSVLVVHSQTEQAANGIHATLNGNVQIANELKLGGNLDMGAAAGGGVINIPNGSTFTNTLYVNNVQVLTGGGQINFPSHTHFGSRITSDVDSITIASSTASIDLDGPSMGEVTLPASGDTLLEFSNATDGQIYNLLIKQGGNGTVSLPASILQPSGSSYTPTTGAGARDILTLATYDHSTTNEIYLVNVVNLV